jgi:hypothetical protein
MNTSKHWMMKWSMDHWFEYSHIHALTPICLFPYTIHRKKANTLQLQMPTMHTPQIILRYTHGFLYSFIYPTHYTQEFDLSLLTGSSGPSSSTFGSPFLNLPPSSPLYFAESPMDIIVVYFIVSFVCGSFILQCRTN